VLQRGSPAATLECPALPPCIGGGRKKKKDCPRTQYEICHRDQIKGAAARGRDFPSNKGGRRTIAVTLKGGGGRKSIALELSGEGGKKKGKGRHLLPGARTSLPTPTIKRREKSPAFLSAVDVTGKEKVSPTTSHEKRIPPRLLGEPRYSSKKKPQIVTKNRKFYWSL